MQSLFIFIKFSAPVSAPVWAQKSNGRGLIGLKRMFGSKPLVEFYSPLHSEKLQNLKKIARKMFVLFASTYICEQTFSVMKVNKSKNRSLLTDSNLQSVLRISTGNLMPNFNKLVNDCSQMHHSH